MLKIILLTFFTFAYSFCSSDSLMHPFFKRVIFSDSAMHTKNKEDLSKYLLAERSYLLRAYDLNNKDIESRSTILAKISGQISKQLSNLGYNSQENYISTYELLHNLEYKMIHENNAKHLFDVEDEEIYEKGLAHIIPCLKFLGQLIVFDYIKTRINLNFSDDTEKQYYNDLEKVIHQQLEKYSKDSNALNAAISIVVSDYKNEQLAHSLQSQLASIIRRIKNYKDQSHIKLAYDFAFNLFKNNEIQINNSKYYKTCAMSLISSASYKALFNQNLNNIINIFANAFKEIDELKFLPVNIRNNIEQQQISFDEDVNISDKTKQNLIAVCNDFETFSNKGKTELYEKYFTNQGIFQPIAKYAFQYIYSQKLPVVKDYNLDYLIHVNNTLLDTELTDEKKEKILVYVIKSRKSISKAEEKMYFNLAKNIKLISSINVADSFIRNYKTKEQQETHTRILSFIDNSNNTKDTDKLYDYNKFLRFANAALMLNDNNLCIKADSILNKANNPKLLSSRIEFIILFCSILEKYKKLPGILNQENLLFRLFDNPANRSSFIIGIAAQEASKYYETINKEANFKLDIYNRITIAANKANRTLFPCSQEQFSGSDNQICAKAIIANLLSTLTYQAHSLIKEGKQEQAEILLNHHLFDLLEDLSCPYTLDLLLRSGNYELYNLMNPSSKVFAGGSGPIYTPVCNAEYIAPGVFNSSDYEYEDKLKQNVNDVLASLVYITGTNSQDNTKLNFNDYILSHNGQTYDMTQCIGYWSNGNLNILNTRIDDERKKLESMFENCDIKSLESKIQEAPAIAKLDVFKLKRYSKLDFLRQYENVNVVKHYHGVDKFIKKFINEADELEAVEFVRILSNEHLARHGQDLEKKLNHDNQSIINFEERVCKIACDNSVLKTLNEKERIYLSCRKFEIEQNKQYCEFLKRVNINTFDDQTISNAKQLATILESAKENQNLKTRLALENLYGPLHKQATIVCRQMIDDVYSTYGKNFAGYSGEISSATASKIDLSTKHLTNEEAQKDFVEKMGIIDDLAYLTHTPIDISSKQYQEMRNTVRVILNDSGVSLDELNIVSKKLGIPNRDLYQAHTNNTFKDLYNRAINYLSEIATSITDSDAVKDLKNLGIACLRSVKIGDRDLADILLPMLEFSYGAIKEGIRQFIPYKAMQWIGKNKVVQVAAGVAGTVLINQIPFPIAFQIGQFLYVGFSTYSIAHGIAKSWSEIDHAFEKGDFEKLGAITTKIVGDSLFGYQLLKSIFNLNNISKFLIGENETQRQRKFGAEAEALFNRPEVKTKRNLFKSAKDRLITRFGKKDVELAQDLLYKNTGNAILSDDDAIKRIEALASVVSQLEKNPISVLRAMNFDMASQEAKIIEEASNVMRNVPGYLKNNCPLLNVIKNFGRHGEINKGSFHEIKRVLEVHNSGEIITFINKHFAYGTDSREFDIVTASGRFIESKCRDWSKLDFSSLTNTFEKQIIIARAHNGRFEVHSGTPIPDYAKRWFRDNGVLFFEG